MTPSLSLSDIRDRWNDVLDHLESQDRVAWIAYFDARLAEFDGETLALDFRDARKLPGGHEYSAARVKLENALKDAIAAVFNLEVQIREMS